MCSLPRRAPGASVYHGVRCVGDVRPSKMMMIIGMPISERFLDRKNNQASGEAILDTVH